jgi:hypothetical protein
MRKVVVLNQVSLDGFFKKGNVLLCYEPVR